MYLGDWLTAAMGRSRDLRCGLASCAHAHSAGDVSYLESLIFSAKRRLSSVATTAASPKVICVNPTSTNVLPLPSRSSMMNKAEPTKLPPCLFTSASLTQAVNETVSGDTIVLQAGRHVLTGTVHLKEPITLLGEAASTTQIDGGGRISLFSGG